MNRTLLALFAAILSACNGQLDHLGRPPSLTPPGTTDLAVAPPTSERIALMPPPPSPPNTATTASLWQSGPKSLFGDRRARRRGDILTVVIEISKTGTRPGNGIILFVKDFNTINRFG